MGKSVFSTPFGGAYSTQPKKKKKKGAKTASAPPIGLPFGAANLPWGGAADITAMLPASYTKEGQNTVPTTGELAAYYAAAANATGGGGVAGVSDGSGGGYGADASGILNPWTGFAGQYAGGAADLLMNNMEIPIRDKMKAMGFDPDSGMLDLMEEYGPAMQYLAMLGLGGEPGSLNALDPGNVINYIADFTEKQMTPGAGGLDAWGMLDTILNAPKDSALAMAMNNGDPEEQANTLNNLMMAAVGDMPVVFQRAFAGMLEDKTSDWLSSKAKGTGGYAGFLYDWLKDDKMGGILTR
jgi:hypothetical protein